MKQNIRGVIIIALIFLFLGKVIISGLYLKIIPSGFASPDIAQAQEEVKDDKDLQLEARKQEIRKKEMELSELEKSLKLREERLAPLQNEINSKFEELNELQTTLTAYAKQLAEREKALKDAKISHLVALYSAMEPDKAAAIMDKLDIDIIVRILGNMKGKSAGQILAVMNPEKGALISERLSRQD